MCYLRWFSQCRLLIPFIFILLVGSCSAILKNTGLSTNEKSPQGLSWYLDTFRPKRDSPSFFGKIIDNPECQQVRDVCGYVHDSTTDLTVLGCIQNLNANQMAKITEQCQHVIWTYISTLMDNINLQAIAKPYCAKDMSSLACPVTAESGALLSCLIDNRNKVINSVCRAFVQKLEWVAFSDFRLISSFVRDCQQDVETHSCGRLSNDKNSISQGETLACLQTYIDKLNQKCKQEVLHLSEMQADNVKYDRQLYISCATDQLRFCPDLSSGAGVIYKCLMLHKSNAAMSKQCQEQLSRRQKLIAQDYRVSRGLSRACKDDIRYNHCRRGVSEDKDIRLAQILVCLESVMKNNSKISSECQAEMIDHRKMLLEDYHLSPEIMHDCADSINKFCAPVEIGGKTIHCLMEHARPKKKKEMRVEAVCQRALETLVKQTDIGEDWRVDPVLRQACKSVVDTSCKEIAGGEGRVMSCLIEKLGTAFMTEECETAVVQIQYFVTRDFKLDPQLYKSCKEDAVRFCHAKRGWTDENGQMDPERGPLVLPCLYRYAFQPQRNMQLAPVCLQEIRRVMRQRAISVDLQPEIEEICLDDLAMFCFDRTAKGEEMSCLQTNLDSLMEKCRIAVTNYTEAQAGHVELNPVIMKNCHNVMEKFCPSIFRNGRDEGDVMDCLISHKNEPSVRSDVKCRASIEHFQLISLKNYHFTYKFKEACRSYVMRFCPQAKTKSEVITCLSEMVRNDTIDGNRHSIPKDCRQQLRTQLFQQKENIDYDPKLSAACKDDLKKFCSNIDHGASQALECLQNTRGKLSSSCQHALFTVKKQELNDNSVDYNLITTCSSMITLFCHDTNSAKVLECLKIHKEEATFDEKCKLVVVHRMIDQNSDYRFNPMLQSSCKPDIRKFCSSIIASEPQDKELQGKVIRCLKNKFREAKLSSNCEHQMASVLREQALNYHLDPLLSTMCRAEIETICKPTDNSDTTADGEVEECLKQAFLRRRIVSEECRTEVASLIGEARADIQADPLLQRACAVDLLKWCNHLDQGNGRHIKCLQIVLTDETKVLEEECKNQLTKRMEMFKSASVIIVPVDFQDLYDQVAISPSKKYFIVVMLTFLGIIFIFGMFCGRVSRKAMYMKRK